jgi:hypothetical protein
MVPTALTHQNTAIATAATVCANSFPGDQGRFIIPFLSSAFQEVARENLPSNSSTLTGIAGRRNGENKRRSIGGSISFASARRSERDSSRRR